MKTITVFLFSALWSCFVFCQKDNAPPLWLENADSIYEPDNFTYQTFRNCKKNHDAVKVKEGFTEELKKRLASKIYTSIDSERTATTIETKTDDESTFTGTTTSDISMQTHVDLTQYDVLDYFDKKHNKLHLIIIQNKVKLEDAYEKKIRLLMSDVEGEILQSFDHKRTDEIVKAKLRLEKKIKSVSEKIDFFSFLVDASDVRAGQFQTKLTSLKLEVSNLSSLINNKSFEDSFARAQQLFNDGKCKESYVELKRLLIKNASDNRVISLRDKTVDCQTRKMENEVHDAYANKQYERCLTIYEDLIRLNEKFGKDEHFIELRDKAFKDYINDKFNRIENIIDIDIRRAENILNSIKWFGLTSDSYKPKYDDFESQIKTRINDNLKLEFKNQINNKEFRKAHALIVEISGNSINDDVKDITHRLKKQWEKKVRIHSKKLMLYERPQLYSLKLNMSFLTPSRSNNDLNNSNILSSFQENLDYLYPYYSVGIYRKFKIKPKFTDKNHRDKSSSYLIGFKFGIQDYSKRYKISEPDDSLVVINEHLKYELQLSSLVLRCFNLNYGVFFDKSGFSGINFYSTTFGLKIPLWRFDLDMNAKFISDYKSEHHFLIEGGLSLNFDFKKKFTQKDRDQLKLNIQNYK